MFTNKEGQQLYINNKGFAGMGKQSQYANTDPGGREFAVLEDRDISFLSPSPFTVLTVDAAGFVVGAAGAQILCIYNAKTEQLVMSDGRQVFDDSEGWVKAEEGAMAETANSDSAALLTSAESLALYVKKIGFLAATTPMLLKSI